MISKTTMLQSTMILTKKGARHHCFASLSDREFLFRETSKITKNIAYYLPRTSDAVQIGQLAGPGGVCEVESNVLNHVAKSWTAYFGDLATVPEEEQAHADEDEDSTDESSEYDDQ